MENLTRLELRTLTDFQRQLHVSADKDDSVEPRFTHILRKKSWSANITCKVQCSVEDQVVVYRPDHKMHFLLDTYLKIKLPALSVKDEYRDTVEICWPVSPGINIISTCQLCFDNDVAQFRDDISLNIYNQHLLLEPDKRDHHNRMIGNLPFLLNWTNRLPEQSLTPYQNWYFSMDESFAIPLFECKESPVTFKYKYKSTLDSFLRMRQLDQETGEWIEIRYNSKYINGNSADDKLPIPEMWGIYAQSTDDEISWLKSYPKPSRYIEDFETMSDTNSKKYGESSNHALHSTSPCKALFWVAENLTATSNRNYSNFTTNISNLYEGWNPISSVKFQYGSNSSLIKFEWDSSHSELAGVYKRFPSVPIEPGYNAYAIAYSPGSVNSEADVALVFEGTNANLTLTLGNTDPFSNGESMSPSFKVHIRLLVIKKLEFENGRCRIVVNLKENKQ